MRNKVTAHLSRITENYSRVTIYIDNRWFLNIPWTQWQDLGLPILKMNKSTPIQLKVEKL